MIEAPLVESALNLAAEEVLEFSAFGRVGERLGNRCRERAPQGVYRCEGDERWVALSVEDEQWPALVDLLGAPEWAQDPALSTLSPDASRPMISLTSTSPIGSGPSSATTWSSACGRRASPRHPWSTTATW
jgi:crotonobetainyl-CoA:carnitine CoA-transferase CaiB-like acyl-CoA transferase